MRDVSLIDAADHDQRRCTFGSFCFLFLDITGLVTSQAMKIGRSTGIGYSRRTTVSEKVAPAQEHIPKRKALLIGITYGAGDAGTSYGELKGPHGDVAAMRALLVARYNYAESDIVVLLDKKDAVVQPTRANIVRLVAPFGKLDG
jgi:hypothetical protein